MAKKKKLAVETGKAEPLQPKAEVQNEKGEGIEVDSDSDSDNGTFLDDDTEDFLPSKWTGKPEKGRKDRKAIVDNEGTVQSIAVSMASVSITSTSSKIKSQALPTEHSDPKMDDIEAIKLNTVMVSRHAVPAALVRNPGNATDTLQAQISSLKHQLEKKEKDFKASKQQPLISTSELAEYKKLIDNLRNTNQAIEDRKSQLEINNQGLRDRVNGHAEVVKNLEDEHKEELRTQRKQHKKDLRLEVVKSKKLSEEVAQLTTEKQGHESTIAQLRREISESAAAKRRLQMRLEQEQQDHLASRNRCFASDQASADFRKELAELRDTRSRQSSLGDQEYRRLYQRTYDELSREKRYSTRLKNQLQDCEKDCRSLKYDIRDLEDDLRDMKRKAEDRTASVLKLTKENAHLERKISSQKPLVQVGTDIRLRFLEQARERLHDLPKSEVDRSLIDAGNCAAHRAKGMIDKALFSSAMIYKENYDDMEEIFRKLYGDDPIQFPRSGSRMVRITDCKATLAIADCTSTGIPFRKREEHEEMVRKLEEEHTRLGERAFERDYDVRDLLEELEDFTDKIVNAERYKRR